MKKGKILIVDDNEDILFTLKLLLRPLAESVTLLSDPRELLPVISRTRFDVILLDMNFRRDAVSGKEGFHWLEEILRLDAKAVVIFITAYADTEKAVQAIKQGATDFIPKPWQNEKLLATVSSALQLSFSRTEVEALKKQKEKLKKQQETLKGQAGTLCRTDKSNRGVGCHARHFPDHPQIFRHRRQPPATGRKRNGKGFDCQICLRTIAPEKGSVCADRLGKHPRNIVRKRALRL